MSGVWGLRFGVWRVGFEAWGLGFEVLRFWGFGWKPRKAASPYRAWPRESPCLAHPGVRLSGSGFESYFEPSLDA